MSVDLTRTKSFTHLQDLTVCICTINLRDKASLLLEKYESIVVYTNNYFSIEAKLNVIIVDDCSDLSHEIYLHMKHLDIRIIRNMKRLGLAISRNIAINAVTTKWLLIVDDDDIPSDSLLIEYCALMAKYNVHNFESICFYGTTHYSLDLQKDLILSVHDLFLLGFTPPVSSQFYKTRQLQSLTHAYHGKTGVDHSLWISLLDCNARIFISPAKGSYMNRTIDFGRMTFDNSRIKRMIRSLDNWRPILIRKFSTNFYTEFKLSTLAHVNFKILSGYYRYKDFSSLALCLLRNFDFSVYKRIIRRLWFADKHTRFFTPFVK